MVIEEAGRALAVEALPAIIRAGRSILIAGDERQTGPNLISGKKPPSILTRQIQGKKEKWTLVLRVNDQLYHCIEI